MVRTVRLLGAAALLAACYNYEPLRTAELVPSAFLAVTLSDGGSERLAQYVGPNVLVVRGRFRIEFRDKPWGDVLNWLSDTTSRYTLPRPSRARQISRPTPVSTDARRIDHGTSARRATRTPRSPVDGVRTKTMLRLSGDHAG